MAFESCRRIKGSTKAFNYDEDEEEDAFALKGERSLKESFYQYLTQKKKLKLDDDGEILESQEYGDDSENSESEMIQE